MAVIVADGTVYNIVVIVVIVIIIVITVFVVVIVVIVKAAGTPSAARIGDLLRDMGG